MEKDKGKVRKYTNDSNNSISSSSSSTSSSEDSSNKSSVVMPTAPDGGYGWVIVFSAFIASVISDGISFSLGVLYTRLLEVFQESKSVTSWIPSLFYGVSLMGGPLAGALVTKFGCRRVAIFGGLLTSLGLIASSFANSVTTMCFTLGFIAGFGISMEYVTSLVMVAFYFQKKRALATGLSVCGSGIGTFLFAPLMKLLMDEYDWRGTLLIFAGISLNLVVCGALLRPLEFTREEKYLNNLETFEKISRTISKASLPDHSSNRSRHVSNSAEIEADSNIEENGSIEQLSHSQVQLPTFLESQTGQLPEKLLVKSRRNGSNLQQLVQKYLHSLNGCKDLKTMQQPDGIPAATSSESVFVENSNEILSDNYHTNGELRQKRKRSKGRKTNQCQTSGQPLLKKDLFYRGNLMKLPQFTLTSTSCPELNFGSFDEDDDSSDDEDEDICLPKLLRLSKHMKKLIKTMFDLSILCNPVYILFLVSNFMLYFWIDVPYVFIVDRAIEVGISDFWASFLVSIIGILNTVGQIVYGFLGDTSVNLTLLYGVSTSLCGASLVLVPLFVEFIPLAVLSGGFGLCISANYVLSTVILVEFMGMDKLTNAYGLTMLMQGMANLIGPPVAGRLYDVSGNYDNTFYVGGTVIILSGLLLAVVPLLNCLVKMRRRQQLKRRFRKDTERIHVEMTKLVMPEIGTAV